MNTLELKNISYTYKNMQQRVLDDISYSFEKGRLYTIMGK